MEQNRRVWNTLETTVSYKAWARLTPTLTHVVTYELVTSGADDRAISLGLNDLKNKLGADPGSGSVRAKTEDELIIALTEIMKIYGAPKDSAWEKEFQPETEHGERELPVLRAPFPCVPAN